MLFFDKSKIKSLKERYNTIEQASPATFFKEKGSKFYGYAFPLSKEEEVKSILEGLKKQHPSAGHFCYAWQLGEETIRFRVNDDGEPNNSAGQPIYGQIRSFDITNILVVVVRFFGGTNLGVGGLIQAYKYAAQLTLESATIVERTIDLYYQLTFEYALMNKVMRIIKEKNVQLLRQSLDLNCTFHIAIRKKEATTIVQHFDRLHKVKIEEQKTP